MKICIETHTATGFGEIPEGSLWDDDSEYVTKKNAKHFKDVADEQPAA